MRMDVIIDETEADTNHEEDQGKDSNLNLLLVGIAVTMTLHMSHLDDDRLIKRGDTNHEEDHGKDSNKVRSKDPTTVPFLLKGYHMDSGKN